MLYSSFKVVHKFKFCVSPLVKRYPWLLASLFGILMMIHFWGLHC